MRCFLAPDELGTGKGERKGSHLTDTEHVTARPSTSRVNLAEQGQYTGG